MKKLVLALIIAGSLLFAAGHLPVEAQEPYTYEMLLEALKKIPGAKVTYGWEEIGKINFWRGEGNLFDNGMGCVAKVTTPNNLLDTLGWPSEGFRQLRLLHADGSGGGAVWNQYIHVDDLYCKGGGRGSAMVPQTTPLFSLLNLLYVILALLAVEILTGGRIPIPVRR